MIKTDVHTGQNQPICKKIQNYIFKFADLLGKGNFSKVYKAHHQHSNQIVAVKIIELNSLKSQKLEELLFSEIDVLKKLNHPNILKCHEVFTSNRNCYIITELCNGGDLETKLRREHHFSEQNALPIIKDIFSGLVYLSHRNVIHRDLKVANVFLHNGRAKIADFGFAKFTKQNFKDINIGSPIYMSPEGLIHNIYGPKTDIWAFGVLIYELLHGETPYAHCRTQAELKYHVSIPINQKRMRSQLSPQIKEIISLCMETDETKRVTTLDLQDLPYFRRLMEKSPLRRVDSPTIQKKYSSASQKYVGASGSVNNNHIIQKHNFMMNNIDDPLQNRLNNIKNQQKKSPSPLNDTRNVHRKNQNVSVGLNRDRRGFSTEKRIKGIQKDIFDVNYNNNISKNSPNNVKIEMPLESSSKILSVAITFKECVNILHYCRLIYKYIIALRDSPYNDDNQVKTFTAWLLTLMEEIKNKINNSGIVYEGQNAWLREKKLREVTNEYSKKYRHQLGAPPNIDTNLGLIKSYSYSVYEKIDSEISKDKSRNILVLGHSIVMICDCTHLLKRCYDERNYKNFGACKELQQFLNKSKDTMDSNSYMLLRKKISFIKDKST